MYLRKSITTTNTKNILLFVFLLTIHINFSQAQCNNYPLISISTTRFSCGTEGDICFIINSGESDCSEMEIHIEFPTGSFLYTNLGNFSELSSDPNTTTTLSAPSPEINQNFDVGTICLSGILQIPNTNFEVTIVNPSTGTIIETINFSLDGTTVIGSAGANTLLSTAISNGLLFSQNYALNHSQRIEVNGTLIVDVDYTFGIEHHGIENEIIMNQDAKIEINPNINFRTILTNIYSCDNTWDRILVKEMGNFVLEHTKISNASVGIELTNNSNIEMLASRIFDCNTGIGSFGINPKNIDWNIYFARGGPYGFAGIPNRIANCTDGMFLENVLTTNLYPNSLIFNDILDSGIELNNSSLFADEITFNNCNKGVYVAFFTEITSLSNCNFYGGDIGIFSYGNEALLIDDCIFNSLYSGITLLSIPNQHSSIKNNYMYDCTRNIQAFAFPSRAEIHNNRLYAEDYNINLWGIGTGRHNWAVTYNETIGSTNGNNIFFNNMSNARVFENQSIWNEGSKQNIEIKGGKSNYIGFNQIYSEGADNILTEGSPNALIACNGTDGGVGLTIQNNCNGSTIRGNGFHSNELNLVYGSSGNQYAHTGGQFYQGNGFDNSTPANPKAGNFTPFDVAKQNEYKVGYNSQGQGTSLFPFFSSADPLWFHEDLREYDYICEYRFIKEDNPIDRVDQLTNSTESGIGLLNVDLTNIYGQEIDFDAKLKVFRSLSTLDDIQNLENDKLVWFNQMQNSDVSEFITFENAFNQAIQFSEIEQEQAKLITDQIELLNNEIKNITLYSLDEATNLYHIDEVQKEIYDSKLEDIFSLINQLSSLVNDQKLEFNNSINYLTNILNNMSSQSTSSGQNLININKVLLKKAQNIPYTIQDIQIIENIANLCSGNGGEAVYLARSLRSELNPTLNFSYNDECIQLSQNRMKSSNDFNTSINISPNPANEYLQITMPFVEYSTTIEIHNTVGILISTNTFEPGIRQIKIDTKDLLSGVYFITSEQNIFSPIKFIIQHN